MRAGPLPLAAFLLLAACNPDMARYDAAVARMTALDARVDAAFDAARAHHDGIFAPDAWDDRAALATRLEAARERMAAALADHDRRLDTEREILDLSTLDGSPDTRVLYHLDLKAQEAKREVLALNLAMYEALIAAARDGGRDGGREAFAEVAGRFAERIQAANDRYRELDLERQRGQERRGGVDLTGLADNGRVCQSFLGDPRPEARPVREV